MRVGAPFENLQKIYAFICRINNLYSLLQSESLYMPAERPLLRLISIAYHRKTDISTLGEKHRHRLKKYRISFLFHKPGCDKKFYMCARLSFFISEGSQVVQTVGYPY